MTEEPARRLIASETRNHWMLLSGGGLFLVGLQFGNPQLVLPWMGSELGVSPILIALIVPAVHVGQILGQLLLGPMVARLRRRKWALLQTVLVFASAIALAALASGTLQRSVLGLIIVVCACIFGVGWGLYAVVHQDLMAKAISDSRRGKLMANRAALGGLLTMVGAACLQFLFPEMTGDFGVLLWIAVGLWGAACLAYAAIYEEPQTLGVRPSVVAELERGFGLVKQHLWFRDFLVARFLFLTIELALPFYTIYITSLNDPTAQNLTLFVFAVSFGLLIGGPVWGRLMHRHCHLVIACGAWLVTVAGVTTMVVDELLQAHIPYFHAGLFVILSFGRQGVVQGRIYYLSLQTPPDDRPIYISIADAMMGGLGVGIALILGWAAHFTNIFNPLLALIAFNMIAAVFASQVLTPRSSSNRADLRSETVNA